MKLLLLLLLSTSLNLSLGAAVLTVEEVKAATAEEKKAAADVERARDGRRGLRRTAAL